MLHTQDLKILDDVRAFLDGIQPLELKIPSREAAYELIAHSLSGFRFSTLGKTDKGLLRCYLGKVTGLSRAQITRLIAQFRATGCLQDRRGAPACPFARRYTREDVLLLAEVDALHGTAPSPGRRHVSSVIAPIGSLPIAALSAWLASPMAICTTCAAPRPTGASAARCTKPAR